MQLETKDGAGDSREIKHAFGDFLRAFEEFKGANDARLAEIEKRSGDVIAEEKVDRINRALDEQKKMIDELTLAAQRPVFGETKAMPDRATRERKAGFDRYMRKGDASGFELKAATEGTATSGGYVVPLEIATTIDRILAKASPIRALATVQQIGSNVYRKPITTVEAASGWVGETDARTTTTGPTIADIASSLFGVSSGRATGGPVMPGSSYLVGEQGPELFTPSGNGAITPNAALSATPSRPSIVLNVNARDAQSFMKSETQIAVMMARALARGQRNL